MPFMDWMGAMMGIGFLALPLVILFGVFWIWMLIDLLQRRKFEDKLVWVLVLIFLNVLGAVLYYFLVYSKGRK